MKNIIVGMLLCSVYLNAASFDCKKASTQIEKEICSNDKLGKLDEELAFVYKTTKKLFAEEERHVNALRKDQIEWMKTRNTECRAITQQSIAACVQNHYNFRINELREYQKNYPISNTNQAYEGIYKWKASNSEAALKVKFLANNKYFISGDALYGTKNEYGPNLGMIDFIAAIQSDETTYTDKSYRLTMKFEKNKVDANENKMGDFGLNVVFSGTYIKEDTMKDFKIDGQVINPACIKLMQPWKSEHSNIIVRSIVLENCQNSNVAFSGIQAYKNGETSYCEDPNDGHTCFEYKYLGKTDDGTYFLFHQGYVGAYFISEKKLKDDLKVKKSTRLHVLTKIGDSLIPCFQEATIDKNQLIIVKKKFDAYQPTAFQCQKESETIILNGLISYP